MADKATICFDGLFHGNPISFRLLPCDQTVMIYLFHSVGNLIVLMF